MARYVLTRRLYDDWHVEIADRCSQQLDRYEIRHSIYLDGGWVTESMFQACEQDPEPVAVFVTSDHNLSNDESPPTDMRVLQSQWQRMQAIPKQFIYLDATYMAQLDGIIPDNVSLIHTGGDFMFQMREYPRLVPQSVKRLASPWHWISLTHTTKMHRSLAAAILLGSGQGHALDGQGQGLLRLGTQVLQTYRSWRDYLRYPANLDQRQQDILDRGWQSLLEGRHGGQPSGYIYEGLSGADNASNFDRSLRHLYSDSLVEIVNETTFFNHAIFATEKYINSVYGFNLPIVISNAGTVRYLRDIGFDLFDDIIDHGYDLETDAMQRLFLAIESNLRLLCDREHALCCWNQCRDRMQSNYELARDHLHDVFRDRVSRDLHCLILSGKLQSQAAH